jgi:hypothetical protein
VYGVIFGFCAGFSFLPYLLRKDRVEEAVESTHWNARSESETLTKQVEELYRIIRVQLEDEPRMQEELEDLCEKIVHICRQYQDLTIELSKTKLEDLHAQICTLKERVSATADATAKHQYEQTLINKEKQCRQYESLQTKAERLRAQLLHYVSGLENMRFAYANREFRSAGEGKETIEFFMNMARAETAYDASEAYQNLI